MQITIGIDISKDMLDAYRLSDNQYIKVANGEAGHKPLIHWIEYSGKPLVTFEATGAYHRKLEAALAASDIAFAKVNPRQARRFAEASGRHAKTDRVDAAMLAKIGAVLELKQQKPKSETLHILRELTTACRALLKDKVAAKTRLQTTRCRRCASVYSANGAVPPGQNPDSARPLKARLVWSEVLCDCKARDLIASPAYIVMKAADEFKDKTTAPGGAEGVSMLSLRPMACGRPAPRRGRATQ